MCDKNSSTEKFQQEVYDLAGVPSFFEAQEDDGGIYAEPAEKLEEQGDDNTENTEKSV